MPTLQPPPHGGLLSDSGTPRLVFLLSQLRVPSRVSFPPVPPSPLCPHPRSPKRRKSPLQQGACSQPPGQEAWPPAHRDRRQSKPTALPRAPPERQRQEDVREPLHSAPRWRAEARAASSGKSRVPSTPEQRLYQTHLHHRFLLTLWILNTLYTVSKTSHSLISISVARGVMSTVSKVRN